MTSEPSQQPEDDAHQRGFGLFDAPPAPEEFPVFTPYQPAADSEADAFPPDSDGGQPAPFGGFPSDDSGPAEWSSAADAYQADAYVPAPAVMPIPGVRHDMDPPPSSSGWSTASESYEPDPYSHPSDPNPYGQPPEPGLYGQAPSEPSLYGQTPEPEVDESPAGTWSAFAAGDAPKLAPAPTPWTEAAGYEPASSFDGPSTWDEPEPAPVAFQEPEPVLPPPHVPAQPAAPPPPPSATGSVRVAAAVPGSNRLSPEEVAPAVIPRPAGRVYGSAAAAAPAEAPPVDPAPVLVDPQPAVRATARAAVSVARPEPGEAPPPATRSSTVYGSPVSPEAPPMVPAAPAPPVLPQRPGRQHTFGDLLGPASPSPPDGPPVPAQRMQAQAGPPPGAPYGAPPPSLGGNVPAVTAQRPSAAIPPNRHPNKAMADQFAKPSTTTGSLPAEPKPERHGRIIIGVLIGCVALLAVAFGGLILIDKLFNGPVFVVGDCVKQNDGIAIKAECSESGAFEVKAAVSSPEQCQDQVQPHVQQKDQILCLAPAGAPISANPTTTPEPTATSTPTTQ